MKHTYFPGLNTLRLYAAVSVIVHHFTAPHTWFGDTDALAYYARFGFLEGGNAVTLFFVLSGFLILYLLIRERRETGTVSTARFYVRRAFRILPLYYLTLVAGALLTVVTFAALPPQAQTDSTRPAVWITASFYVMNLLGIVYAPISHLWSLNVEEQFYIFAPHLIRRARSIPAVLIGFIVVKVGFQLVLLALAGSTGNGLYHYVYEMLVIMRFECMAIGGLCAWLVFTRHPLRNLCFHPIAQVAAVVGTAAIIFFGGANDLTFNLISSLVYALLVINVACAPRFLLRFENPLLRTLGDASYAIYMVHQLVIWALWIGGVRGIAYPLLSLGLSIGLGLLIRRYFEEFFLRVRDRVSKGRQIASQSQFAPTPSS